MRKMFRSNLLLILNSPTWRIAIVIGCGLWNAAQAQPAAAPYTVGYRYDGDSRLVGQILPDPDGSGPIHFGAIRKTYNLQGVITRIEHGELQSWHSETMLPSAWPDFAVFDQIDYTYDIYGRKLTEQNSSGGVATSLRQYSYDPSGRVQCAATRMNPTAYSSLPSDACTLGTQGSFGPDRITYTTYDTLDRPTLVQKAYGTTLQYAYQRNVYAGPLQSSTDADINLTYYQYDGFVRLQKLFFPSKTLGAGTYDAADFEQYGYDNNGNRTSLVKRDGETINYTFDGLNRITIESYPAGTITNVYRGYDLRNLQVYARFGSQTGPGITTTYDGFANVATSSTNQSGVARTFSYAYDAESDRQKITHPDLTYFSYNYDGLKRLTTIIENGGATVVTQTFDNKGHRSLLSRGAGVTTTSYGYDPVRLQTLTQTLAGSNYNETRTFGYNPSNQITTRAFSNGLYTYTQAPAITTNYLVNGLNQYTQLSGSGTVTPLYDVNGNMKFDGATTFIYDVLNRMTSASGAKTIAIAYDPNGRLFQTSGGASGTTQFLYDGDALVGEYNGSGTLLRRYVHGDGLDEPLVTYEGSSVGAANRRYFHADHLGSVTAIADTNGNAIQTNTYDPYGVPFTGNSGRFQYTGQILLPDLGLLYYKARIYNPTIGRFMQTDPIGYKDDEDLYSYVGNDPLDHADPSGRCIEDLCVVEGIVVTAAVRAIAYYGSAAVVAAVGAYEASKSGDKAPTPAPAPVTTPTGITAHPDGTVTDGNGQPVTGSRDGERSGKRFPAESPDEKGKKEGTPCAYCGQATTNTPGQPNSRERDHVDPKSAGGNGDPSNQKDACRDCNRSKSSTTLGDWIRKKFGIGGD